MEKIYHVQTLLTEEEINALMKRTGAGNKKDAVRKAIEHYLSCPYAEEELRNR